MIIYEVNLYSIKGNFLSRKTVSLSYSIDFSNTKLKNKVFFALKCYLSIRYDSNNKNCQAYNHYFNSLQAKSAYTIKLETKGFPILFLCFAGWRNYLKHRKATLKAIIDKKIKRILYLAYKHWKNYEKLNTLDSIFRSLELSLKSTCKSLTFEKQVRFNL